MLTTKIAGLEYIQKDLSFISKRMQELCLIYEAYLSHRSDQLLGLGAGTGHKTFSQEEIYSGPWDLRSFWVPVP